MITINDIRRFPVCQDPSNWISEDWQGELIDLYNLENLDVPGKILMGIFFLSNDEVLAFADFCKAQCDENSIDEDIKAKCYQYYNHTHHWFKGWYCSKYAAESCSDQTAALSSQLDYLIAVEQNRGI